MKIITTISFLLIVLVSTFNSVVVQAVFELNRSYIARTLCVNKAKPMLHCNGMCYMSRKMKEQEKEEQQAPDLKRNKLDVQAFFPPVHADFSLAVITGSLSYYLTDDALLSAVQKPVFHPPGLFTA